MVNPLLGVRERPEVPPQVVATGISGTRRVRSAPGVHIAFEGASSPSRDACRRACLLWRGVLPVTEEKQCLSLETPDIFQVTGLEYILKRKLHNYVDERDVSSLSA